MISPYVRRLRLGAEMRTMRAAAGLTAAQLGKQIGRSRADISRLENGHVVDQADVMKILDALNVDGDRWTQVMTIAREAGEKGWWESYKTMGDRQAMYANLEAGAGSICEYQQTFVPGLLQIPEFVLARTDADTTLEPMTGSREGVLAGNADGSGCSAVPEALRMKRSSMRWRSGALPLRPRWSRSSSTIWPRR